MSFAVMSRESVEAGRRYRSKLLRTEAGQTDSLFDLVLPEPLRELPTDLAAIDELLRDDAMLAPFREHWDQEVKASLIRSSRWGRPTIPMATYVRLMVLKHRYRWGLRGPGPRGCRLAAPAPLLQPRPPPALT